ncbi:hypothetical protein ACVWXL_002341 [Bradyrhizobium sp. GM22.5]
MPCFRRSSLADSPAAGALWGTKMSDARYARNQETLSLRRRDDGPSSA